MEPEAHSPDTSIKRDPGSDPPDTLPGGRIHYRIDREHPIGGEMSDVLRGILTHVRLPWLLEHYANIPVLAVFSFINGCISIGIMAALAVITRSPFIFPSLGPTAFLFFYTPPALAVGVTWPRVIAAALSLGLTAGLMVLLKSPHPPAGATTLIISLGILTKPWQLLLLMAAVILLTIQAFVINRLAGIPYPLWNPPAEPADPSANKRKS